MESVKFEELQLDDRILRAVADMGFEEASPIQAKSIPVQMEGVDMIGQAQTGTGKTAAFGIPLLQKIDPKNKKLQAVALCPTRELAIQVAEEIRSLAKYMHGIKVLPIYGGQDYPIDNCDEFLGFLCGIVSQDHDLEEMYLDSFLTIAFAETDDEIQHAIEKLDIISEKYNVKFILSVSRDESRLPECAKAKIVISL